MCGIVGIIGTTEAARETFLGLTTLQHRGQDAAGILSYDQSGFHQVKNVGLVESVFTRSNMEALTGQLAIGHARYSTIGKGDLVDVQPFLINYPYGLGLVHNGNVVNCATLAQQLKTKSHRHLLTHSDSEVILNIFADGLARFSEQDGADRLSFEHICASVKNIFQSVKGSYSIVSMIADHGLVAFRDPHGIRPLVWGKKATQEGSSANAEGSGVSHMVASESASLAFLGYEVIRDIQPGEVLFIDLQGNVHTRVIDKRSHRPCMFEWVYFASPESIIDHVPVYGTRIQLGKSLAQAIRLQMDKRGIEADLIVPVPETSRIAAIALAEELKIPYREVLIKNRYIKRTFILDSQEKRQKAVNLKLSPVRSEIQGKRILLVDDSIVRGTTSRKIIDLVKNAGAAKIYFVSTCPPIKHPCFYGIDFPVESELIASGRDISKIEEELGADAVIYQDLAGLENALNGAALRSASFSAPDTAPGSAPGTGPIRPCMACLNGQYPTDVSSGAQFASVRKADLAHVRKEVL